MRASVVVWSAVLLLAGALNNETLGKLVQKPTVHDALNRRPESKDEPKAERNRSGGGHAIAENATGESALDELDDADDDTSAPSEGSRSVGGAPAGSPPSWLAGSWFQRPNPPEDNLFGGFMVRLNDHHVLAHEDTCTGPQLQFGSLNSNLKDKAHEQVSLNLQQQINSKTGPAGSNRLFGCNRGDGERFRNGQGMGVFKLTHEKNWDSHNHMRDYGALKTRPPLQHDPNVRDNCQLHSYSGNPNPSIRQSGPERTFTKFNVAHGGCSGSICRFNSQNGGGFPHGSEGAGAVCRDFNDAGAPILCGADKKLSFLTIPTQKTGCSNAFSALRIADHHGALSSYLNKTNTMPEKPKDVNINCDIKDFFSIFTSKKGCRR